MSLDYDDQLAQEVRNYLEVSNVGLYEFNWILRGLAPQLGNEALRANSEAALRILLEAGDAQLVRMRWPSDEVNAKISLADLQSSDWNDPIANQSYIAIVGS